MPPYALALVHAGLNDRERIYECLDRAFSVRDVHLIYLPVDPNFIHVRCSNHINARHHRVVLVREVVTVQLGLFRFRPSI